MMGAEAWIRIIATGLTALAEIAPEVAEVFTDGRPVDQLAAEARNRAQSIPVRTGDGGTWQEDMKERKNRDV